MFQNHGSFAINSLDEFRDDLVFENKVTNKNLLIYTENQLPKMIVDYQGNIDMISDSRSGCCVVPTTYVLGKSEDYADLLDDSSERAIFDELYEMRCIK